MQIEANRGARREKETAVRERISEGSHGHCAVTHVLAAEQGIKLGLPQGFVTRFYAVPLADWPYYSAVQPGKEQNARGTSKKN